MVTFIKGVIKDIQKTLLYLQLLSEDDLGFKSDIVGYSQQVGVGGAETRAASGQEEGPE